MPSETLRSRIVGALTTLLSLVAVTLPSGCNRAASPAPAAKTASAEKGVAADKSGATAPVAGKKGAGDSERDRSRQMFDQIPVETVPVVRGPISAFLSFNSVLETEAQVDLYPQTGGQVEVLYVEEGQVVKEGDPLLKIEDRELRVEVEDTSANYEHMKRNFARTQDLFERSLINKQDYENQQYQLEQARLRLERAKIRLSYATVRAPFDGVISSRETQVGARVTNGSKVFSIVKLDETVARVFVPGRYLAVVKEDQPAVITSEFMPDRTFKGWVKRISPVIDPKSGTFKVTVGVRGETPTELPPGLFVGVRVITDTRPAALLIPKRGVVYEGGGRFVFTIVDGRAVKRKLDIGYEDPTNVEALSGFEVGMPIIVLGQNGLKDGAAVRVVNTLEPIPEAKTEEAARTGAPAKTVANAAEADSRKS